MSLPVPPLSRLCHAASERRYLGCSELDQPPAPRGRRLATPPRPKDCTSMTDKKIWLVTGAGRGLGTDIARAALDAGHAVVATGRNPDRVAVALGAHEDLLTVALDVTAPASVP